MCWLRKMISTLRFRPPPPPTLPLVAPPPVTPPPEIADPLMEDPVTSEVRQATQLSLSSSRNVGRAAERNSAHARSMAGLLGGVIETFWNEERARRVAEDAIAKRESTSGGEHDAA